MVYMGDPNQRNKINPASPRTVMPAQQQPLHPAYNNGISYNGTDQDTTGATTPQQNTTGVPYQNLNSSYTSNYGRGGGTVTYNPPVTTQPVPTPTPAPTGYDKYNPATWWWRQTPDANGMVNGYNANAVPMGNFPQPSQGITTYYNPNGTIQHGPGQGMVAAPPGSGVAYMPQQYGFGFGGQQGFPGFNYGFFDQARRRQF